MESFEPVINLLTLLTVLSLASERAANVLKLRKDIAELDEEKKKEKKDEEAAKPAGDHKADPKKVAREYRIARSAIYSGIAVALVLKANVFEIMARLDAPWDTLGWVRQQGTRWVQADVTQDPALVAQAVLGCVLTGISLGFGSKFWHDMLELAVDVRDRVKIAKQKLEKEAAG